MSRSRLTRRIVQGDRTVVYDTRRALEDAIEEYAKAYASWCAHLSDRSLTDRMQQRMFVALEQHEAALRAAARATVDGGVVA